MKERIARAMMEVAERNGSGLPGFIVSDASDVQWMKYAHLVEAALDALMEPTEEMAEAGYENCTTNHEPDVEKCWQAMITAAKGGRGQADPPITRPDHDTPREWKRYGWTDNIR